MPHKFFEASVSGGNEIADALAQLPRTLSKAVLRRTATKALQPTRNDAEGLALLGSSTGGLHRRTGRYDASFHISTKLTPSQRVKFAKPGDVVVYCGSSDPKAHLLEFGHRASDGSFVRPYPVLRPAWDATKDDVYKIMKTEVWNEILKTTKRLRRRTEKLGAKLRK